MKEKINEFINDNFDELYSLSKAIWDNPETSRNENFAKKVQMDFMASKGFKVMDVDGVDTAFIAEAGTGEIKVGFLGEYDALPGLSQEICAVKKQVKENGSGHGCGHNLIGVGALAAALALKEAMDEEGLNCTVRYYGCPAEEAESGKIDMIEKGVFNDLHFCLTWHPFDVNKVWQPSSLAIMELDIKFKGTTSHAADAPHLGRSALDAVELMNVGVNYLREHVIDKARIHYIIKNGGERANIVPDFAESNYIVRAPKNHQVRDIVKRVIKIGKGAELMTETEFDYTIASGLYDFLPNKTLSSILEENFKKVQMPVVEEDELEFFKEMGKTIRESDKEDRFSKYRVEPFDYNENPVMSFFDATNWEREVLSGSTDVGDVSWVVPTGQLIGAAWGFGVAAHTWQATACSGTKYAAKVAAMIGKVLSSTAYDVIKNPAYLEKVKGDFDKDTKGFKYVRMEDVEL